MLLQFFPTTKGGIALIETIETWILAAYILILFLLIWRARHLPDVQTEEGVTSHEPGWLSVLEDLNWVTTPLRFGPIVFLMFYPRWLIWTQIGPVQYWPAQLIGLVPIAIGGWLIADSRRALGTNWLEGSGVHDDQSLSTGGPYRFVRNPIYDGYLVLGIAICTGYPNLVPIAGWAITIACLLCRVRYEEQILTKTLGEEYLAYMRRTGRFLPRLRRM